MPEPTIRARLGRRFDPSELRDIKRLWIRHSLAENDRNIDGLLATLTDDAVYEMVPTRQKWHGLNGARAYYTELFGAFPDNTFEMTEIVVGPQGVFEAARLRATFTGPFTGFAPTGLPVDLEVLILFPWDPEARLFKGEKIWFDVRDLVPTSGGS